MQELQGFLDEWDGPLISRISGVAELVVISGGCGARIKVVALAISAASF